MLSEKRRIVFIKNIQQKQVCLNNAFGFAEIPKNLVGYKFENI